MNRLLRPAELATREGRAVQAWDLLTRAAQQGYALTYKQLGYQMYGRLDMGHTVSQQLKLIEAYCHQNQLPGLHLIVLAEDGGKYTGGLYGEASLDLVYEYPWGTLNPPDWDDFQRLRQTVE